MIVFAKEYEKIAILFSLRCESHDHTFLAKTQWLVRKTQLFLQRSI